MKPVRALWWAAVFTLIAGKAQAQLCTGRPTTIAMAMASRDQDHTVTGLIGFKPFEKTGFSFNAARIPELANGSSSASFGGRIYFAREWEGGMSMCVLTGAQRAMAHLINAEGLNMNARIKETIIPAALGLAFRQKIGGAATAFVFAVPQYVFINRNTMLYDRSDTLSVGESPTRFGYEVGAGMTIGPLLVRAASFKFGDSERTWSFGVGLTR